MGDVVNAGATAAERGLLHLAQLKAGDRPQQAAWLLRDALRVGEVAWLLEGDGDIHLPDRHVIRQHGEIFGYVTYLPREGLAPLVVVAAQQVTITLERRTATGRVDDDRVEVIRVEGGDVAPRQPLRALDLTAVQVERATAALSLDRDHLTATAGEQTGGRFGGFGEGGAHDAAGEERHPPLDRPSLRRRPDLAARRDEAAGHLRQQRFGLLQAQQLEDAAAAHQAAQSAALIDAGQPAGEAEASHAAEQAVHPGA
jgi:hypothetical protein